MEEQVLIFGDGCYTIVYKTSIIFDQKNREVTTGSKVKYFWPEKALHKKAYIGNIIKISSKFPYSN